MPGSFIPAVPGRALSGHSRRQPADRLRSGWSLRGGQRVDEHVLQHIARVGFVAGQVQEKRVQRRRVAAVKLLQV